MTVQQQFGYGFAHNVGAAHHHGVLALEVYAHAVNQAHDAGRGAGNDAVLAQPQAGYVSGVETVHVLLAGDGVNHLLLVDVLGKRQLHQDTVYQRVVVEGHNLFEEGFLGDVGGQFHQLGLHAGVGGGLHFVADIYLAGGVFTHDDDHQAGLAAVLGLEDGHFGLYLVLDYLT